jgi:ribonuclease G
MAKEIIVNADAREARIAVREDGQLVELHIEREERVVGSIYKARVESVHHGMDASFVDIGLDRNAFLFAGDIVPVGGDEGDDEGDNGNGGNGGKPEGGHDRKGRRPRPHVPITALVKRGQEVLVQVAKGPRGSKGARVSTRISLPGRYLVFMPDEASVGVSRKIDDPKERDRLKRIVDTIKKPGYGLIVRTEAEDKTERELRQDLDFLERTWADIKKRAQTTPAPNLVYADLTLLFRILRDAFGQDVDRLILDSATDYKRAHELLDFFGPNLKDRVVLYDGEKPVFEHFGIEQEIERLLGRRVWLKSGGYLVIDQAEALVAIDVNSGRFTGSTTGLADTIVQTNLEAVGEIARQLRLRDMGGILVLDLIDMNSASDRKRVETALETALKGDKTRCKISHISPLGLVEMTRKRTGEAVTEQMSEPCPYCSGEGKIASPESVAIEVARDLRRLAQAQQNHEAFLVRCHPHVAAHLVGEDGEDVEALEHTIQRGVYVRAQEDLHQEKYEIVGGKMDDFDRKYVHHKRGQVVEAMVMRGGLATAPAATAYTDNGFLVDLAQGARFGGQSVRVRLHSVGRSSSVGEPLVGGGPPPPPGGNNGGNGRPPLPVEAAPRQSAPSGAAVESGRADRDKADNNNRKRRNKNRSDKKQPV